MTQLEIESSYSVNVNKNLSNVSYFIRSYDEAVMNFLFELSRNLSVRWLRLWLKRGIFTLFFFLFHRVLLSIEKDGDVIASENPPPSLLMLSTAHKWLGEKSMLLKRV